MYVILSFYKSAAHMYRELGYSNKELACLVYADAIDSDRFQIPFITSDKDQAEALLEVMKNSFPNGTYAIREVIVP